MDTKPFLSFILNNHNLDKEDIRVLKRKIADLRARDVEESLEALKGHEARLQEMLQLGTKENGQ